MVVATLVNVLLALVPRAVMAVMHTTMIRASMTAYSTAVGPSSRFKKLTTLLVNVRMDGSFRQPGNPLAERVDPRFCAPVSRRVYLFRNLLSTRKASLHNYRTR